MAPPVGVDWEAVSVGLEPDPSVEPAPVVEAAVLVLPAEDAVVDGDELLVEEVVLPGFWAPQGLSTRHAVWQAESWGAHAATH
jgi:hypothetical protein